MSQGVSMSAWSSFCTSHDKGCSCLGGMSSGSNFGLSPILSVLFSGNQANGMVKI